MFVANTRQAPLQSSRPSAAANWGAGPTDSAARRPSESGNGKARLKWSVDPTFPRAHLNDSVRQRNPAHQPGRGDAPQLPGLRHERDRRARPARCTRRLEACAPARIVCDARAEQRLKPPL